MFLLARLFWTVFGVGLILLALYHKPFLAFLDLKPQSELFTSPRLQHSAHLIEKVGQVWLIVMGGGFLLNGVGKLILSTAVVSFLSGAVALTAGLLPLILGAIILSPTRMS